MTDAPDIKHLRELLAKATPGPWSEAPGHEDEDHGHIDPLCATFEYGEADDADLKLIIALHAAAPALLDAAEA